MHTHTRTYVRTVYVRTHMQACMQACKRMYTYIDFLILLMTTPLTHVRAGGITYAHTHATTY